MTAVKNITDKGLMLFEHDIYETNYVNCSKHITYKAELLFAYAVDKSSLDIR